MLSLVGWHIGSREASSFGLVCSISVAGLAASPSWVGLGTFDPSSHAKNGGPRQSLSKAPSFSCTVQPTSSSSTSETGVTNGGLKIWSISPLPFSSSAEAW